MRRFRSGWGGFRVAVTPPVVRVDSVIERVRRGIATAATSPQGIMLLAVLLTLAGSAAVLASGTLVYPEGFVALTGWNALVYVLAGLYWRARRPENRLGTLLVLLGFCFCAVTLQAVDVGVLPLIGVWFEGPLTLLGAYLVLVFPSGQLDRFGAIVLSVLAAAFVCAYYPWVLLSPVVHGNTPVGRCTDSCPRNALQLADNQDLAQVLHGSYVALRLLFAGVLLLALAYRMVVASRPRRRALTAVYASTAVWVVSFGCYSIAVGAAGVDSRAAVVSGLVGVTAGRLMLPIGFLIAPMQAHAFAGVALERIVQGVDDSTSLSDIERLCAETLDDPHLRLAFWVTPGQYVDAAGESVGEADTRPGRRWSLVGRGSEPGIKIDHDEALDEEPELIEAVGSAVLLVLEKRTMQNELARSTRRITKEAQDVERRRIERDLHDSAQQRLIALQMQVDLARDATDDRALSRSLSEVGDEIAATLTELRSIAHGLYPPRLAQGGLVAAVADAASHLAGKVEVEAAGVGRYLERVETAVFFCILEAIQNAVKYAGREAVVAVVMRGETDGRLRFEVTDNGAGFDSERVEPGFGFNSMADRIAGLGGVLTIVSAPGKGTTVGGVVPTDGEATHSD